MKGRFFVFALFFAFVCRGWTETPGVALHVADAVPGRCSALTRQIFRYGVEKDGAAAVESLDAVNALRGMEAGKFQLLLVDEAAVPENFKGRKKVVFADVLAFYAHIGNPVSDVSGETLRKILSARRFSWESLNGSSADIHLYAVGEGHPGGGLVGDVWRVAIPGESATFANTSGECLLYVGSDPAALAAVRFQEEYPVESVKVVAVDGVFPSRETIADGSYRPMRRYVWLAPEKISPEAEKFLDFCKGNDFREALKENDLFPVE